MITSPFRKRGMFSLMLLVAFVPQLRDVARAGDPPIEPLIRDTTDASELWKRGSDQVLAGDFKSARATIERITQRWPDEKQAAEALAWL